MINKNRAEAKARDAPPADSLPVEAPAGAEEPAGGDEEELSPADTGVVKKNVPVDKAAVAGMLSNLPLLGSSLESTIGATIGDALDEQAEEAAADGADEAVSDPEPAEPAEAEAETDEASGMVALVKAVDVSEDKEDKDYEAMLMHMSMSAVHGAKVLASIAVAAEAGTIDEGDESDADSEFGDDIDADEGAAAGPESVFARMERVRSELEAELGFDAFFDAYKALRDVFSVDQPPTEVPAGVEETVKAALGDEHAESYHRMLEMVKAENGIFE